MLRALTNRYLCQMLSTLPAYIGGTLRLNRAYNGPILNVYNGTTTKDVWSVNEIAAFAAGATTYVATIYDQSGNGRNYTQATTTKRPQIYNGSALLRNGTFGPVIMRFDGVDDRFERTDNLGLTGSSDWTQFHLAKSVGSANGCYWGHGTDPANTSGSRLECGFIPSLGNVTRVSTTGSLADIRFTDSGGTGALSKAFHYDVIEITHGVNLGSGNGAVWRINGTTLTPTTAVDGTTANLSNAASYMGDRPDFAQVWAGDAAVFALWTPKLGTADRAAVEKWAEVWRVQ